MFDRPHHRRIARLLESLDAGLLDEHGCLFGGGTAIALRFGEYRESVDVDFLVSRLEGYRELRQRLSGSAGIGVILKPGEHLTQLREVRVDHYGIRTLLQMDGAPIKFEIVLEGRIELDPPGPDDRICGVATLTPMDMATSKLLANADRWRDDAVFSRDLIDLAMMKLPAAVMSLALAKATQVYGDSVVQCLRKAIDNLRTRPHRLDQCMRAMDMTTISKAALWSRIRSLET